jgi:hypothetical protein
MACRHNTVLKCGDSEECVLRAGDPEYIDEVCADTGTVCRGYDYGAGVCAVSGYAYVISLYLSLSLCN